jgi:hypothetical protein
MIDEADLNQGRRRARAPQDVQGSPRLPDPARLAFRARVICFSKIVRPASGRLPSMVIPAAPRFEPP